MKRGSKAEQIRAGLFVVVGLLVFIGAIFLLGKKNALFAATETLFVDIADVNGLVVGAPVRLAGLEVGTVAAISFPKDLENKLARVRLQVRSSYLERIRTDSRAFVDSNGLLGDKIINISMGDASLPQLKDGDTIESGQTLTFEALSNTLHEAINSVNDVARDAQLLFGDMRENRVQEDVKRITTSIANILSEVESGKGTAHRLIYDPRYAEELQGTLSHARGIAKATERAMQRVDAVLAEVERGDGGLHQLVYGTTTTDALHELSEAGREIAAVVREVREGDGLLHTLVYDEDRTSFIRELDELSATLNRMVKEIDQGRGTIGGLIKDPTVYEDFKTVLGNVRRNVVFKSLVRFTLERDNVRRADEAPEVEMPAPSNVR
jgi:phospholipid/cholesterol/gamma-HCH transport system substrate-binding protein